MDLWSLLALAAPGLYPRADTFSAVYRRPIESGREPELLDRLRTRIRPLMLRRTKSEVAADLPEKQVQVLDIAMNPQHERIYSRQLQRERQRVLGLLDDPEANRIAILLAHPVAAALLDPALVDDEHAEVGSAKIDALVEHLTELRREGTGRWSSASSPASCGGSRRASIARASPRPTSTARRPTARTSSGAGATATRPPSSSRSRPVVSA